MFIALNVSFYIALSVIRCLCCQLLFGINVKLNPAFTISFTQISVKVFFKEPEQSNLD
jgi:hypothetical protein